MQVHSSSPRDPLRSSSPHQLNATPTPNTRYESTRKTRPQTLAFNFDSQMSSPPKRVASPVRLNTPTGSKVGQRRGHHHKHSLSHQFFLPPPDRAPLSLSPSFPVPGVWEALSASTGTQRVQIAWSLIHFLVAIATVQLNPASLSAASVAKCLSFDAFGVFSSAVFDIMNNFPVWGSSSIRHSFGLRRSEVIVGFGATVYQMYSGLELFREVVERVVIGGGHSHGVGDQVHIDPHSYVKNSCSFSRSC